MGGNIVHMYLSAVNMFVECVGKCGNVQWCTCGV